jgi:hypothetical protein
MIIYISGPMTGLPDNNREAFEEAHQKIVDTFIKTIACGDLRIINPLYIGKVLDGRFDVANMWRAEKATPQWSDYMRACITELCKATHALFIEGWEKSKGASLERHIAEALEIPCVESVDELITLAGVKRGGAA